MKKAAYTDRVRYNCGDAALAPGFISKCKWPAGVKFLDLEPRRGLMRMDEPLKLEGRYKNYGGGIIFKQGRDNMPLPLMPDRKTGVAVRTITSRRQLCELYASTQDVFHKGAGKKYITADQLKASALFRSTVLVNRVRGGVALKGGKPVGMIAGLKRWIPLVSQYAWFITWVWLDRELRGPQRAAAKAGLLKWLKENSGTVLMSHVHIFNQRSQRFFLDLGFKPVRVRFYRV